MRIKQQVAKEFTVELCSVSKDGDVKLLVNGKPYRFDFGSKAYFEDLYWKPHTRSIKGTSARVIKNKGKFLNDIKNFLVKDPLDEPTEVQLTLKF